MMCHYVIFDFAFSCTQSALIALPHTDISRKGNMTNISHLTLPFPPSLHLSCVHNHPSSSNQCHLDPQPPRPMTPTPDTSSPHVAQLSTLDRLNRRPRAQRIKPLHHPALNLNHLNRRPQRLMPQVPVSPGPQPSTLDD